MKIVKSLLSQDRTQRIVARVVASYVRLVYRTSRWTFFGEEIPRSYWERNEPFIACFWHGRMLMMPFAWPAGPTLNMLVSAHRDGQMNARILAHFGIKTVAGSTARGGASAVRGMVSALRRGESVAVTPDGPRGPGMQVSVGIIKVASLARVPIIPVAFSSTRRKVLTTWDRFLLAWPFGRGVYCVGKVVDVPTDADGRGLELARQRLQEALDQTAALADRVTGHPVIEPSGLRKGSK